MATNCEDGALCFETYDKCSLFAQRLNNRPDLDIQAYCERQSIYKFKYAPIKLQENAMESGIFITDED